MWLILETHDDGAGGVETRWSAYETLYACQEAWRALVESAPVTLLSAQWFAEVYPSGRLP